MNEGDMSMFSPLSKNLLRGILVFSVIVLTIPIRRYEEFAGLSSELAVLIYCFGLVIGFAFMLSALALEDTRKQPVTPFPVLKNSGLAVLVAILLILVVTAVCVGNFLAGYMPEKADFSVIAYGAGLLLGFASVAVLYYLPKYLPQMDKPSED